MLYEKKADERRHFILRKHDHDTPYQPMPHYHSSIEIFVITKGRYQVLIDGDRRILEAGDVAFVDRFTPHTSGSVDGEEDFCAYVVVASSDYLSGFEWLERYTLPPFTKMREGFMRIVQLIELGYAEVDLMDEDMQMGFVTMLLGMLRGYCEPVPRGRGKSPLVAMEIMKYIGENFASRVTLDSLAEHFGYERTYLSRLINQSFGMNLREYLNRVRISAVLKTKQTSPDIPVYKIASACGFESENTYYRAIKKYGTKVNF